jgi:hypothetical protein
MGQVSSTESAEQVEGTLLACLKGCDCANLAYEDDSGKTVVEKSGYRELAKALTFCCYYAIRPCICSQRCLSYKEGKGEIIDFLGHTPKL